MKKMLTLVLAIVLVLVIAVPMVVQAQAVGVTALATLETPYHQITTLFIEYSEPVVAPAIEDYVVMDMQTYNFLEIYERRPYQTGSIAAVYTNDAPAARADRTSVPGKFVVIELNPVDGSYYDEADGMWRPNNIAGIATVRLGDETCDHLRKDWSLFVVAQRVNVVNEAGEIVAEKGLLPIIAADGIVTPEAQKFTQQSIKSANGPYDIYFNVSLPEGYDESKQYPVVFCQPGAGGGLDYPRQDAEGGYLCLAGNVTRDMVPIAFTRLEEDLIVVAVQPWTNPPAEWGVDNAGDYIQVIEYVLDNYAADANRLYGVGNSRGTMITSQALNRRPDLFAAYLQCNGAYTKVNDDGSTLFFTLFNSDVSTTYKGYTEDEIWALASDKNRLEQSVIDENGAMFDGIVENKMPIYFFDGVNTEVLSPFYTVSPYLYLKERYQQAGLSEEEIDNLLAIDLAEDDEFHARGVCEYHESSKIIITEGYDAVDWLLSKSK